MKIKWGALVVDGRNKIGGQVASKNKSGSYMKNKVTPTNPKTTAQANARANLTTVSRSWSLLTQSEREAWNAYAAQYPYVDIFGDSKYLTGFNYFLKCNLNLLNAESHIIAAPPSTQDVFEVVAMIGDATAPNTLDLVLSVATCPINTKLILLGSPCLSAGRQVAKSDLRQFEVLGSWTGGAVSVGALYAGKFGNMTADQRLGIASFCINTNTGLTTQLRSESIIV